MAFPLQPPELDAWAAGFPIMLLHAGLMLAMLFLGATIYGFLTPYREIPLIREGNSAAALSFGGMLAALALPLAFALATSKSWLDVVLWGVTTTIVQLFLVWVTDLIFRGLPERVRDGDVASAALMTAAKLATAAILAGAIAG
jgi:putative membrane protein